MSANMLSRLKSKPEEIPDITLHLPSLQFDSALTPEQKELLYLRGRSHAIVVTLCAQATFFVDVYSEAKQLALQLKSKIKRKARILKDFCAKEPLFIGVIGCGRIGSQIAQSLLTFGRIHPNEIFISTRRPETLELFHKQGVECYFNNVKLASSVDILFLCVLPSQMAQVAEEIKDHIRKGCIVYCPVSSLPSRKLQQLLDTTDILHPDYYFDNECTSRDYNFEQKISSALENRDIVEQTNPFTNKSEDFVIKPSKHFGDAVVHCLVNMCTDNAFTIEDTLDILHWAMFCETEKEKVKDRLKMEDFFCGKTLDEERFPRFNLIEVQEKGSPLSARIKNSPELEQSFSKRYWEVFDEFIHLNTYGHV